MLIKWICHRCQCVLGVLFNYLFILILLANVAAGSTWGQCLAANWFFHPRQAHSDWSPVKHLYP